MNASAIMPQSQSEEPAIAVPGLSSIVNLGRFPINQRGGSPPLREVVETARRRYRDEGIATFPGFLLPDAVASAIADIEQDSEKAWVTDDEHNIYLDNGDTKYGRNHIRNRKLPTKVASLAYDRLGTNNVLRTLYESDDFREFLAAVLDLDKDSESLYRSADPLGACSVNIFRPGWEHAFHFDQSAFSTTLMLQRPDGGGGDFYHTSVVRDERDVVPGMDHSSLMESLVDGKNEHLLKKLEFEPGTLSLFRGNKCLHRVSKCHGVKDRLVAVFCFFTKPDMKNSALVQKLFWGRSSE